MRRYFHLFVLLALATLSRAQVRGWEGMLVLPTYEEGMPTDWWDYTAGALAGALGQSARSGPEVSEGTAAP
jgi:hypothetical protein